MQTACAGKNREIIFVKFELWNLFYCMEILFMVLKGVEAV
jgi:hypothetical protein